MVFNQKYSNFKIRLIFGVYLENSPVNTMDQPHGSNQCGYIHLLHGSDLMETVVRVGNLCRLGWRICNHCAPALPPGHTLGQVSTYYPLWIFSTAATHMTTSVTVSRTSADKVIHRGVITNMCTLYTGWALRAVRSIHNIHSAHSARGRGWWRCIV